MNSLTKNWLSEETRRVAAIVRFMVISGALVAEFTDGAAGHGGEDPQGGRGPAFSYQRIYLPFILRPLDVPLQLPPPSRLILTTEQVIDVV